MSDVNRKPLVDAAESKTLRMRGNSLRGNRETLETPCAARHRDGPKRPMAVLRTCTFPGSRTVP